MKLKKIASLAMAGVMAVSMLAGCSTTSVQPEPTPDPDPTPNSNYGTTLWNYLDEGKKTITFEANSTLDGYLQTAVNGVGSLAVYSSYWLGDTVVEVNTDGIKADVSDADSTVDADPNTVYLLDSLTGAAKRLQSLTGAANDTLAVSDKNYNGMEAVLNQIGTNNVMNKTDDDITAVALYVVDGSVNIDNALYEVAQDLDEVFMDLDYTGNNTNQGHEYVYKYTGSVSVVSKAISRDGANVNFIAVQVDRTTVQR